MRLTSTSVPPALANGLNHARIWSMDTSAIAWMDTKAFIVKSTLMNVHQTLVLMEQPVSTELLSTLVIASPVTLERTAKLTLTTAAITTASTAELVSTRSMDSSADARLDGTESSVNQISTSVPRARA